MVSLWLTERLNYNNKTPLNQPTCRLRYSTPNNDPIKICIYHLPTAAINTTRHIYGEKRARGGWATQVQVDINWLELWHLVVVDEYILHKHNPAEIHHLCMLAMCYFSLAINLCCVLYSIVCNYTHTPAHPPPLSVSCS